MSFPFLAAAAEASAPDVTRLVTVLVLAIVLILVLILKFRIQAFVSLLVAAIFVGIASGTMSLVEVGDTIVSGMGSSLGFIATIIGLGAIFGQMIEHSGGAQSLANGMLKAFGEKRADWAMMLTGFLISIPVFLDVGVVILAPIIYALTRRSGKSVLVFALPLLAGMAVTHAFVPPTPGPTFVAYTLGAPIGTAIIWGVVVGLPTALVCIPFCRRFGNALHIEPPSLEKEKETQEALHLEQPAQLPSVWTILLILGGPIVLIVISSIIEANLASGLPEGLSRTAWKDALAEAKWNAGTPVQVILFLGHPVIALLVGTCVAIVVLGILRGVRGNALMEVATKSLGPAGIIILITGAGGVFKTMLIETQVGNALAAALGELGIGPLLLAWIFSSIVRVAQGSATVAMVTGAALIGPVLEASGGDYSAAELSLITIAIAAGSTGFSHVNDSGFWIVSRYFGMTERETLLTWTPIVTIISVVGLIFASLLWFVI
jgi:Gnt-I system low-affinity gluconate transporter